MKGQGESRGNRRFSWVEGLPSFPDTLGKGHASTGKDFGKALSLQQSDYRVPFPARALGRKLMMDVC